MGKTKGKIAPLLEAHFKPVVVEDLVVMQRVFPFRMRADVQRVLEAEMSAHPGSTHFGGVLQRYSHEGLDFSRLMVPDRHDPAVSVPPRYEEMDIGEGDPLRTLDNGLWLLQEEDTKFAVLLAHARRGGALRLAPSRNGDRRLPLMRQTAIALEDCTSLHALAVADLGRLIALGDCEHSR